MVNNKQTCHGGGFQLTYMYVLYVSELLTLQGSHKIKFLELAILLALVFLPTPSASQADNTTLSVTYSVNSVEGSEQLCSPEDVQCAQA